ncbi:hypothetical protein N0465_30685, partial [Pseudomonas aeruginosa]|nr:hypothetical protein [Pseudomonas aeruginosa]MCS8119606.1 hypothetical protein [Pseudomonas aeruginosa]MCT0976632.1 hypothetical protein [Pseudomonas aeruginosa]
AASRLNSAENVRRCLLIRHLSHGEDFRLNRCPGSVDHYNRFSKDNELSRARVLEILLQMEEEKDLYLKEQIRVLRGVEH